MPSALALPKAEVVCSGADRETWLSLRAIGGSDIAAILGIEGAWGSRRTAYLDKIGTRMPMSETVAMASGSWYEQRAAERFSFLSGIETIQPDPITMYRSTVLGCATASPDRLTADGTGWVEIKWVGAHRASEWHEPPPHYWAQCQWGLAVSGLSVAYLFAEIGGQDPRWFEIPEDPEWQAMAFEAAREFWKRVESRIEPEVDGSEATKRSISAEFSEVDADPVEGGAELALAVAALLDAQADEKVTSERLTKAENAVKLILREHAVGTVEGQIVATWKEQGRRGLDLDAVRAHLGAEVSKFEQSSAYRVLRIPKGAR